MIFITQYKATILDLAIKTNKNQVALPRIFLRYPGLYGEVQDLSIAIFKGAIALLGQRQVSTPTRRQAFNYHPPQLELQPFTEENLAKRLAATAETIRNYRVSKSPKEFESWCRQRDPGGVAWRYQNSGLYHPVK